jgi:plasmid stability protein
MNAKLTLRLDESLIESAKIYAASHGSSVSQMVANYFAALGTITPNKNQPAPAAPAADADWEQKLGPITRSLIGILKAPPGQAQVSEDDYHAYLERKYLGLEATSQTGSPS